MKKTSIIPVLAALLLVGVPSGAQERQQDFREALSLFESGAYTSARAAFDALGDPLSKAYSVLCAVKSGDPAFPALIEEFERENPASALYPQIHFAAARNRFDAGRYAEAEREFSLVREDRIAGRDVAELVFKKGYCAYARNDYPLAQGYYNRIALMPHSIYTAPAQYGLGYISYSANDFARAEEWFAKSGGDSRFKALSEYYIMECRFMARDYAYIVEKAPDMLETLPEERRGRLARMISEAYLVRGDNDKALEYYRREQTPENLRTRADFFHAGSVLYAVGDYEGAIENFTRMGERRDSIGQIASYDMGYSYIQTKNKVAAAEAFREASAFGFDSLIQEDAAFNAAKLSFDLNGDTLPFENYMRRYDSGEKAPLIYNYMAIAALNKQDYAGAIDNYSKIDELDETQMGNYVKANYLRAGQLISAGSWSDAIPFLRAAGFYYPKSDRFNQLSRYWLAEASYNAGRYADAESVWTDLYNNSALRGTSEGALLSYNLGYAFLSDRKYAQAARWFDIYGASGDRQNRMDALTRRADCDFARRSYKEAVKSYGKVLDEFGSPDNVYPYYQQALSYGLSGDRKGKINALSAVLGASPEAPLYSEAMYELGRTYMESGQNSEAVDVFEKLRTATSDKTFAARALIGKGMACRNMKDYDTALAQYKQVVDLLPGSEYSEEALLAINSIYQTTGTPEKYIEYLEDRGLGVGKTAAEREDIYFNTAEQVYLAGNYSQAVASLGKYLEDFPNGARKGDALFYLADSYRQTGDKEKACEAFAQAGKNLSDGSFAEGAALGYASLSYELGRYSDAYDGYVKLQEIAMMSENKVAAMAGKMNSAFAARMWQRAVSAAEELKSADVSAARRREASFVQARAYLAQSDRENAFALFRSLAQSPSTPEGAESTYMLAQDYFDSGKFGSVENLVYDFAAGCGSQTYWLARCYVVLADSFAEKGNASQAKATLESIRDGYEPSSGDDDILAIVNEHLSKLQ